MKIRKHFGIMLLLAVILLLGACTPTHQGDGQPDGAFDPENPKEYGVSGIYLGQGIKEAMDVLKPTKYDFMDAVTRESYTVEQLAEGKGTVVMGMILINHSQMMVKVRNGVLESIILGGISREDAPTLKTNRGIAMYDSVEKVRQLYGQAPAGKELIYKGSKYQALFSIHDNKVIGFRFDPVQ
jgi:hypothetical protein